MISKKMILASAIAASFTWGCVSKTVEPRHPAGTGDVDSSTLESLGSYKLPITRNGKKSTRIAYNLWSGEWPSPIIDVKSHKMDGFTTIQAFTNLRSPTEADRVSCTIKNGLYHPWSEKDPSIENYYTITNVADFKVIKKTAYEIYNLKTRTIETAQVPKGAEFLNVVYYAENYCGAIYKLGKTLKSFSQHCDFFYNNPDMIQTSQPESDKFNEQWLYFTCQEKDASGKPIKAFIRDEELMKHPEIKSGCPGEYGTVKGAKHCSQ